MPPVSNRRHLLHLLLLQLWAPLALSTQYKVGDLDSWGLPPPSNPHLYSAWSQSHHFKLGDSLLFLYPPSQDSVLQVTERAFNSCSTADPILRVDDGNSLFNLTSPGTFYFVSGAAGHCGKRQKIEIAVPAANGTFFPPAAEAPAAAGPAGPTVFGPIPMGLAAGSGAGAGAVGSLAPVWISVGVASAAVWLF